MQTIVTKDAPVSTAETDDPNGAFEVVLSAPTKDRDGETLLPEEWKRPLPDHITFDADHQMSVAGTVGSGVPSIHEDGTLRVKGTFASTPLAQQVRALVVEGHIRTTSVAFMSEKVPAKDGKAKVLRELLNGAFVAIPSNREALVLSSKAAVKEGRRNSTNDATAIQGVHDSAVALGAACQKAASAASPNPAPANGTADVPAALALAADAALDAAAAALDGFDLTALPDPVQQALGLVTAAAEAIDSLLETLGVPDPDDPAPTGLRLDPLSAETGQTRTSDLDGLRLRALAITTHAYVERNT